MSDEFDIPVDAGTEENAVAPVEETGPADAAVVSSPVSSPAASPMMDAQPDSSQQEEPVTEATTVDKNAEVATRLNLNANNDAGTSAAQQAWQENFGNTPAAEGAAPITAVAMAERQEAKDKKKEDALDAHEERQREFERSEARRKDWLERDHQMGDLTLSGADLEKLMNFIKNPAIQKKIESALKSKGVDAKAIQKGQSEMDEYIKLKEKEQEHELTKEEKARLQQINKSPEFKVYAAEAEKFTKQRGMSMSQDNSGSFQLASTAADKRDYQTALDDSLAKQEAATVLVSNEEIPKAKGFGMAASAADVSKSLKEAKSLTQEFTKNNVIELPKLDTSTFDVSNNSTVATANKKATPTDSFSASLS